MKQMARGAMAVLALIGFSACVDDPQERINNDDFKTLQAYPEVAFIRSKPDSSPVYFRLINDFGYGTPTHLTLKEVTGTIRVKQDTGFRKYYTNGDPNPSPEDSAAIPYLDGHLQRWYVYTNGVAGEGTFTLQASNGVETTVRVRVEAADLGTLPSTTAVAGQTITLTAPPFQKFLPDAQVTYLRGARPAGFPCTVTNGVLTGVCPVGQLTSDAARAGTVTSAGPVTSVSADGKTLTFRAATDIQGIITVTRTVPTHSGLASDVTPIALNTLDTLHVAGFGTKHVQDYTYGFNTDTILAQGGSLKIGGTTVTTANPGDVVTLTLGGLPGSTGSAAGNVPLAFLANSRIFFGATEVGIVHTSSVPPIAAIGPDSNTVQILVPAHLAPIGANTTLPVVLVNGALNFDPTYLFGLAQVATTATQPGNPGILKITTITGTGNTAPATNYAGSGARATAIQLPKMPIFPSTAANSRAIMVNDANDFFTGGDCALAIYTTLLAATTAPAPTRTIGGCKIYKLAFETSVTVEADLRWATGAATASDLAVFTLAETGNAGALLVTPCPSQTTGTAVVGCALGSVITSSTGGKAPQAGLATTAVNGQYIAIVWYNEAGSVKPTWTSLRLTFR